MVESTVAEHSTTVGDIIKKHRIEANLSLTQLAFLSGLSKGSVSRIERGETKRPELDTIQAIKHVLDIPYQDIIERYIEEEERPDVLLALLSEAILLSDPTLISRVAAKFLQSPREDTYSLLGKLYNYTSTVQNTQVKLFLYNIIVKYARNRGVQAYLARGLFQTYMIERQNLSLLEQSYRSGEEILHYVEFLSRVERVTYYYRMSLHAHNIRHFENCIEMGKMGHAEDPSRNDLKERVALAICNSFLMLGKYDELEEHLTAYEEIGYRTIAKRSDYYRALILSKKGNVEAAIPLLKESLKDVTDCNRIYRVNELLEALFQMDDLHSIEEILKTEETKFLLLEDDPNQYSGWGRYCKLKGTFLLKNGVFDEGIATLVQGIHSYSKIRDYEAMLKLTEDIVHFHCEFQKDINVHQLGILKQAYKDAKHSESEG